MGFGRLGDGLALGKFEPGGIAADVLGATVTGDDAHDIVAVGRRDGDTLTARVNG